MMMMMMMAMIVMMMMMTGTLVEIIIAMIQLGRKIPSKHNVCTLLHPFKQNSDSQDG